MKEHPALRYEDVTVSYGHGRPPVLDGCSFEVHAGERVALLGLNGSGKTTLLAATVGLVPFQGQITVGGTGVNEETLSVVRQKAGFLFSVPEDQLLFPKVIDDVAFSLLVRGANPREAKAQALAMLAALDIGEAAERAPQHLSHGERLRAALGGVLVANPAVLLLDEPSAALDPPGKKKLSGYLLQSEAAMLIATHDLAFAKAVAHRFVLLERGRVASTGASFEEIEDCWGV